MNTEELFAEMIEDVNIRVDLPYDFGAETLDVILKFLHSKGYRKLPAEWHIADDGFGDPVIWMPTARLVEDCIGIRFMAGNARIEKPVADWLWENIRKGES